jgi:hypothetical protein
MKGKCSGGAGLLDGLCKGGLFDDWKSLWQLQKNVYLVCI